MLGKSLAYRLLQFKRNQTILWSQCSRHSSSFRRRHVSTLENLLSHAGSLHELGKCLPHTSKLGGKTSYVCDCYFPASVVTLIHRGNDAVKWFVNRETSFQRTGSQYDTGTSDRVLISNLRSVLSYVWYKQCQKQNTINSETCDEIFRVNDELACFRGSSGN